MFKADNTKLGKVWQIFEQTLFVEAVFVTLVANDQVRIIRVIPRVFASFIVKVMNMKLLVLCTTGGTTPPSLFQHM